MKNTESKNDKPYVVYTDGSALDNPGPGGYGVLIKYDDLEIELNEGYQLTTNNRQELLAAIIALENISGKRYVQLHTDSQYLINGITKWIHGWKRKEWISSDGETPVKNKDLWIRLEQAKRKHHVSWIKVPAHSGIPDNERVDKLAKEAAKNKPFNIDQGYLIEIQNKILSDKKPVYKPYKHYYRK